MQGFERQSCRHLLQIFSSVPTSVHVKVDRVRNTNRTLEYGVRIVFLITILCVVLSKCMQLMRTVVAV